MEEEAGGEMVGGRKEGERDLRDGGERRRRGEVEERIEGGKGGRKSQKRWGQKGSEEERQEGLCIRCRWGCRLRHNSRYFSL